MQFWYEGFPVIRRQVGPANGMSYWYDGFPVSTIPSAVADGAQVRLDLLLFQLEIEAVADPLIVPLRMTQMARRSATEEAAPAVRITQLGRGVLTEEAAPAVRVTQMARRVLYPFTCDGDIPGPEPCPPTEPLEPVATTGCGSTIRPAPV